MHPLLQASTPSPPSSPGGTNGVLIDPNLLAVLPLAGIVLTVIAGLVAAAIQAGRDHRRWVRESRYVAYVAYLKTAHEIVGHRNDTEKDRLKVDELNKRSDELTGEPESPVKEDRRAEFNDELGRLNMRLEERTAALKKLRSTLVDSKAAFQLLGPSAVANAEKDFREAPADEDDDSLSRLEAAMRRVLKIKY